MLALLLLLIVIGVLFWGAQRIMAAFGLGEPIRSIVFVFLVIIAVVAIADAFGVALPFGGLRLGD